MRKRHAGHRVEIESDVIGKRRRLDSREPWVLRIDASCVMPRRDEIAADDLRPLGCLHDINANPFGVSGARC